MPFDEDPSWDQFIYHLRVLSLCGVSFRSIELRMVEGRLHRDTLKKVNDVARRFIDMYKATTFSNGERVAV